MCPFCPGSGQGMDVNLVGDRHLNVCGDRVSTSISTEVMTTQVGALLFRTRISHLCRFSSTH